MSVQELNNKLEDENKLLKNKINDMEDKFNKLLNKLNLTI
jgi:phage shock protein A